MTRKTETRLLGGLILVTAAPAMAQSEPPTESTAALEAALETREMIRLRGDLDQLREEVEQAHRAEPAVADGINLGGAVRFNYGYRDWNQSDKDKLGTAAFDTFRINADGSVNDVLLSAEFRWYRYQNVLHHAWAGYNFTDNLQAQLGVSQVPFGLLPYASHSFWFGLPYYVGLEDDYDSGLKLLYSQGDFSLDAAFYKNAEWGAGDRTERYSYDVVQNTDENQFNEESNQLNLQARYNLHHAGGSTELGVSGQYGQLYNTQTEQNGDHWAAAAHANIFLGRWNLMLEAGRYAYNPENPAGADDDVVRMGAYADDFGVAAESDFVVANLAYGLPVDWGPVSKVTIYENYSRLIKRESGFEDSELNVAGAMLGASPLYVYFDLITGKNMPYQGPAAADRLLYAGNPGDNDYHTRVNINVGYYF